MKTSTLPDGMPVLTRGQHRSPKRGACFMEIASLLAGEKWSDHPSCTHPLLGQLARQVNDHTTDAGRHELMPLIPSVIGRRGDEGTWLAVSVAVASSAILDVPERTQRVLAAGLLRAEQLCVEAGPSMAATAAQARAAIELVPAATAWVDRLELRDKISAKTFTARCAPTMIRCTIDATVAAEHPDCDRRLRTLLEVGIGACPADEVDVARSPAATNHA